VVVAGIAVGLGGGGQAGRFSRVMVERVDTVPIQGKLISFEVVGVFEVGGDGLIKRFQEYYDSKSITDQIKAAGIATPT
jgi:limonene-1,2-epoxide hydrolase